MNKAMHPTKEKILNIGAQIVRRKGFNFTGIQEILQEAGVPKGSFYFYFKNKEEFGLELVEVYLQFFKGNMKATMQDTSVSGLQRIRSFFKFFNDLFVNENYTGGCPLGNLAIEMGDLNDNFSRRVSQAFKQMDSFLLDCLRDARHAGEITTEMNLEELARFILNSWEGAVVRMKVDRSLEPIELLENMLFNHLLKS